MALSRNIFDESLLSVFLLGHSGEAGGWGVGRSKIRRDGPVASAAVLGRSLPRISLGRLDEHREEMRGHTWVAENSGVSKAAVMIEGRGEPSGNALKISTG